ncbi:MAG: FkbM family methyltransferase [Pseudomonadota bacterium]
MARRWWRALVPFPRRSTLRHWFPGFETRNIVHLIGRTRADWLVDVGANEGQYVRRLRSGGLALPALSVEPLADMHARLSAEAARDPLWHLAPPMALGASLGRIEITRYADASLSSALAPHPRAVGSPALAVAEREEVALAPLDVVMAEHAPSASRPFVKLDVQGYEMAVMAGASETLARAAGVQIELSLTPGYADEPSYLETLGALDSRGFVPVYCAPVTQRRRLGPWLQMDAVLMRREDV